MASKPADKTPQRTAKQVLDRNRRSNRNSPPSLIRHLMAPTGCTKSSSMGIGCTPDWTPGEAQILTRRYGNLYPRSAIASRRERQLRDDANSCSAGRILLDASCGFLNGVIEKSLYAYPNAENTDEERVDSGSNSPAQTQRKCQADDNSQNPQSI